MAIFRREGSAAKPILFLYFFCKVLFGNSVIALDSNKLVLHWNDPSQVSDTEAGSLSFTNVPSSVSLRSSAGDIKLQDIPQVIALALGFSSLQNIDWNGLSAGRDIFNRPKANILFIVDGVSKGNTVQFSQNSPTYTIIKNKANSNLDMLRISPLRNFASHISNVLKDKPLVVSFSAQKQFAKAASTSGQNAHTVIWDPQENAFRDEASSNEIKLSKDELFKMFEKADFGQGVKYLKEDHKFVVSLHGKDVSFDMNKIEDFLFFAEVQTIFHLYKEIKRFENLIKDDFPDFFTFGISTLRGLSLRYGNGSQQVAAALHILNNVIPQTTKLFNELYGEQVLVEVVYLEKMDRHGEKLFLENEVNDVYKHVQEHLRLPSRQNFNEDLPEINLKENLEEKDVSEICESVRNKLFSMESELQVSCMDTNEGNHLRFRRDIPTPPPPKKTDCKKNNLNLAKVDNYYDDEFPPIFNIVLWLMIILVLAVYVVSIVMWYMDPGRDSVIYRVTSQHIKSD